MNAVGLVLFAALASPGQNKPAPTTKPKPFLDQRQKVPAGADWSREIVSKKGGTVLFQIDSPGPISILVINATAYKAVTTKNLAAFKKSDILLKANGDRKCSGRVTLPAGSSWFLIQNKTAKTGTIRLQVFN